MATDKELLAEARATLAEMHAELERLAEAALPYGTIIGKDGERQVLATAGGYVAVPKSKFKLGETVLLAPMTSQPFEKINPVSIGHIVDISRVHALGAEVSVNGSSSLVSFGTHEVKMGDRVLLDASSSVIVAVVERAREAKAPKIEKVLWDDIGGQDEAKARLIEAVELPRKHPQVYAFYGKAPTNGILLEGPPGCGKTMLGKAVATSVGGGFISVKGPEILDPYVGVAESNVRNLFRMAEAHKAEHGTEAVIFIDEAEAILGHRGARHNYMSNTIVPQFLTEMDGLERSSAIVVLATNRRDMLDPAVIRDGRVDYKVEVARPNVKDAKGIMDIHLRGRPVRGDRAEVIEKSIQHLYMQELPYSGALIAGLVQKAMAHAITRDIKAKTKTGLCHEDFAHAVSTIKTQELEQYAA